MPDLLTTSAGKYRRSRARIRRRDYISDLAWSCLGAKPAELSDIAERPEVFRDLLRLLPPATFPERKAGKWVNEFVSCKLYF